MSDKTAKMVEWLRDPLSCPYNSQGLREVAACELEALAAERDALKARNAALEAKIPDGGQYREYDDLIVERDALLAQAERMAGALTLIEDNENPSTNAYEVAHKSLAAWRQWKEQPR